MHLRFEMKPQTNLHFSQNKSIIIHFRNEVHESPYLIPGILQQPSPV